MMLEQAVIKTGSTEIPLIAFHSVGFWVFVALVSGLFVYWLKRKYG